MPAENIRRIGMAAMGNVVCDVDDHDGGDDDPVRPRILGMVLILWSIASIFTKFL